MLGSCFSAYQVTRSFNATDDQLAEFDQFGSSIYSLIICDFEPDTECEEPFDLEQIHLNKIISVTKSGTNLVFNMYIQIPFVKQCTLTADEHYYINTSIENLSNNLTSINEDINEAINQLFNLLDVIANVNDDCDAFSLALENFITGITDLADLLVIENNHDFDNDIYDLIEYINYIISTLPSFDFCIVSENNVTPLYTFHFGNLPSHIVGISSSGESTMRVPSRVIKINERDDKYFVSCINNENEYSIIDISDSCLNFPSFIPKRLEIFITYDENEIQCLEKLTDIGLKIGSMTVPIQSDIPFQIIEDEIMDYIESNNIHNYITDKIQSEGFFKALESYPLSIVGAMKYKYKYSHYDNNKCRVGFGSNGCYINFNSCNNCDRTYQKIISLLNFRINTHEYSDFTVELCNGCEVETIIDEIYDEKNLPGVFSLSYTNCHNVIHTLFNESDNNSIDVPIDISILASIIIPPDISDPPPTDEDDISTTNTNLCDTPPSNYHWIDVEIDTDFEDLEIGVGQFKQNVNFANFVYETTTVSSQVVLFNEWYGSNPYNRVIGINIIVERTVSVSDVMKLIYGIINPDPSSQAYADVKSELENLGLILDLNDSYKLTIIYVFVNDFDFSLAPISLPATEYIVNVTGLPIHTYIYINDNNTIHLVLTNTGSNLSLLDTFYYMLTLLNSNVRFKASKTYLIGCDNEEIDFSINFSFKTTLKHDI